MNSVHDIAPTLARIESEPYYQPVGGEVALFESAQGLRNERPEFARFSQVVEQPHRANIVNRVERRGTAPKFRRLLQGSHELGFPCCARHARNAKGRG